MRKLSKHPLRRKKPSFVIVALGGVCLLGILPLLALISALKVWYLKVDNQSEWIYRMEEETDDLVKIAVTSAVGDAQQAVGAWGKVRVWAVEADYLGQNTDYSLQSVRVSLSVTPKVKFPFMRSVFTNAEYYFDLKEKRIISSTIKSSIIQNDSSLQDWRDIGVDVHRATDIAFKEGGSQFAQQNPEFLFSLWWVQEDWRVNFYTETDGIAFQIDDNSGKVYGKIGSSEELTDEKRKDVTGKQPSSSGALSMLRTTICLYS